MTNPFEPPRSALSEPELPPGSPIKAVVLGLLVDFGGTMVAGMVLGIGFGAFLLATGTSVDELEQAIQEGATGRWLLASSVVLGSLCSVLGGYVCARISRRTDYTLGYVLAGLSVVAGLALGRGEFPVWQHILLILLTVACILWGIRLGMQRSPPRA